ncbi:flagellar basal body rod protein [Asticcacaulis sp. EMRT-3]|uniref:flagellar basal body rod C-terminal domain-containing protein n=1 Tax=Asticcacaulis sp. EMRT-3 TaxID=3040349 RepID=UPI0024AFC336|nr:flagellar basal body rod protein [Asticcacaulis sp. EMRT-3]MDI7773837.1 flagellar basal body rod protein [Asticcacaulis sp. EMRT-3]
MDAFNIASAGAISASQRLDQAAQNTVRDSSGGGDILSDLVDQIQSRTAFQASLSVVKTADQMTGSLLDIKA